jgi:hypothetical protein
MARNNIISSFILGLFIALGLTFAGCYIGNGWVKAKTIGRYVTVKGLSERVVPADSVNWGMNIQVSGADLITASQKLERDKIKLISFLVKHGFSEEEIENDRFRIDDSFAYSQPNVVPTSEMLSSRYKFSQVIIVRTKQVEKVRQTYQKISDLLAEGVMIDSTNQFYSNGPRYELTSFNNIKGEMLTEAVENARKSADIFAIDSGSKLGKIKSANQGTFTITGTEGEDSSSEAASFRKKIRALVTQEYYLED